jgi:hypothetical protein
MWQENGADPDIPPVDLNFRRGLAKSRQGYYISLKTLKNNSQFDCCQWQFKTVALFHSFGIANEVGRPPQVIKFLETLNFGCTKTPRPLRSIRLPMPTDYFVGRSFTGLLF